MQMQVVRNKDRTTKHAVQDASVEADTTFSLTEICSMITAIVVLDYRRHTLVNRPIRELPNRYWTRRQPPLATKAT